MPSKFAGASRTIIFNLVSLLATLLAAYGLEISPEDQATLATATLIVVNLVNIGWRLVTATPVHVVAPKEPTDEEPPLGV